MKLMFQMMALAFETDSARVATVLLAHGGSNRSYAGISVPEGHHKVRVQTRCGRKIDFTELDDRLGQWLDRWCAAIALLIVGKDPAAMGVAPAADLISVHVSDEAGKADSFALAAGILVALDGGVHLIKISMGTS